MVRPPKVCTELGVEHSSNRKTGDDSKIRDFLPKDKQYLVTTGVPCLRRATAIAYTDADEDAERLLSFGDSSAPGGGEEWVETHANRKPTLGVSAAHGDIDEIPDLDAPHDHGNIAGRMGDLSLGAGDNAATPDLDDIPDMEEDGLEAGDEATAAPKKPAAVSGP